MDQIKIGAFLKTLRREKNMTQEQLAEQLGVSSRTVSRWETGSNIPDISLLAELAEFYDVSGVCAVAILMILESSVPEGYSRWTDLLHVYCETLAYVSIIMIFLISTGLIHKFEKKQKEINLPKPLLLVISAVAAFAIAAAIKFLLSFI